MQPDFMITVVTWNHHTVFPVFFDGQTIESWWNSMLVIKIHHREPSSRTVCHYYTCSTSMVASYIQLFTRMELYLVMD